MVGQVTHDKICRKANTDMTDALTFTSVYKNFGAANDPEEALFQRKYYFSKSEASKYKLGCSKPG